MSAVPECVQGVCAHARWAWAATAVCLLLQACASATVGNRQDVRVDTMAQGQRVDDVDCELTNDKGRWLVLTPMVVDIQSSAQDLTVRCVIDTHEPGTATFKSSVGAPVFGNIIAGGIIGAVVDSATGAAFRYPERLAVDLGPATGKPKPVKPKIIPAINLAVGDVLEYAVTDRYSGNRRIVTWKVDAVSDDEISFDGGRRIEDRKLGTVKRRAGSATSDMEMFEPSDGWLRGNLAVDSGWSKTYEVEDGARPARLTWKAYVEREEDILFDGKKLRTVRVDYSGAGSRHSGILDVQHRITFTAWVEPTSRRILRFESLVQGSGGAQQGRPTRELIELVRHIRAAGNPA